MNDRQALAVARTMADNNARPRLVYKWDKADALIVAGDGRAHRYYAPHGSKRWRECLYGTYFLLTDHDNLRGAVP